MAKLDGKYEGEIHKKDGTPVPDDEWIVFRAKDNAVPRMLATYAQECWALGASPEHLEAVAELRGRVEDWRTAHPEQCKVPD